MVNNNEHLFLGFDQTAEIIALSANLKFSLNAEVHPLCKIAVKELQAHLRQQQEWRHNFGLSEQSEGAVIGKMFGVLVVRRKSGEVGYLAAFSGKLAGKNHHLKFVPPIFDGLEEGGFLNTGMEALSRMSEEIRRLENGSESENEVEQLSALKISRKNHSNALQNKLFDQYHFLNKSGRSLSLIETFKNTAAKKPPAGAGECAAPKLLQYAFLNDMEPLAMAEFWWGLSPKSTHWKHGCFYPPCLEKCAPILKHMLS